MNWFLYAFLAYAFVSVANITDKFLVEKHIKDSSIIVLFTGVVACVVGLIVYVLRGFPVLTPLQLIFVLAAGVFLELFLLPYFRALELEDASTVVPLFRIGHVFTLLLSYIFLHEILTARQYVGFIFLLGSGIVLSLSAKTKQWRLTPAFWLMMLSSFLFAIST